MQKVTTMDQCDVPLINLFKGYPSPSVHPNAALLEAARAVTTDPLVSVPSLNYGPDEGHGPLREAIAAWLTDSYGPSAATESQVTTSDRITITGGASQNLAAALSVFTDPSLTRAIWLVSPTYYLACRIFDDAGFSGKLRAVSEDEEGIDIAALEDGLQAVDALHEGHVVRPTKSSRPWRKIFKHIIYCVPTFSNPSGKIMTRRRREQLIRLARRHDALIITDDVYDMLCWPAVSSPTPDSEPEPRATKGVPRIVDIDRVLDGGPRDAFGNALSNCSFSKILAPGLRVGFCEAAPRLAWGISQVGSSRSGGAPSQWTSTLVCHLLRTGWVAGHVARTLRPAYAHRAAKLLDGIREHLLPVGVQFTLDWQRRAYGGGGDAGHEQVMGGYFVWLRLPDELGISARELALLAEREERLLITPGDACIVEQQEQQQQQQGDQRNAASVMTAAPPGAPSQDLQRYIRLCFAYEDEDLLQAGTQRLSRLIARQTASASAAAAEA
ncbi:hypothetical protein KEM52_005412 [Ascosphaera acerosa]|nr:hypothetical protein KEM52_005412 [Ascosphaera acerosa]